MLFNDVCILVILEAVLLSFSCKSLIDALVRISIYMYMFKLKYHLHCILFFSDKNVNTEAGSFIVVPVSSPVTRCLIVSFRIQGLREGFFIFSI